MAVINFSGLASGIDSSSLIKALLDQERAARVKPLQTQVTELQDTNSAFSDLNGLLTKLNTAAAKFRAVNDGGIAKTGTSSDETRITATATNSATNGTYSVTTTQLARNATYSFKNASSTFTSADSAINSSINNGDAAANRTIGVTVGTGSQQESINVVITNSTTLNDFVTSFNSQSTKALASVVNAGTSSSPDYRVIITSNDPGTEKGQTSVSVGSSITGSGAGAFNDNSVSQAQDAQLSIDGISGTITRGSNTITDIISGVTLNLQSTGTATISIGEDADSSIANLQGFVDAYNEVVKYVHDNNSVTRDESGKEPTNLFGTLAKTSLDDNVLSSLRQALVNAGTSGRTVNVLADLGITTQRDGTLAFDTNTFRTALASDSEGVRTVTQNLGENLSAVDGTIAQYTRFGGLISASSQANSDLITSIQDRISKTEADLTKRQESLTQQFARLEGLISNLNSQQSRLTAALPR